jgi:parallel beta-helix repeat protein
MTKTYDLTFWVILIFNGLIFTFVFHKSLNYNYNYYEDFGTIQTAQDQSFERELKPQASWWRKGFFSETHLRYPKMKEGQGAVFEIGIIISLRSYVPLIFILVSILIMLPVLFGIDPSNPGVQMMFYMGTFMFIWVSLVGSLANRMNYRPNLFRQLPLNGIKLPFYQIMSTAIINIILFYFWLLILIALGWLIDIEEIMLFFWMGGILLFLSSTSIEAGFLLFSSENELVQEKPSFGGLLGGILIFIICVVFALFLYSHISLTIDSVWKFLYIGLSLIGVIILLIYISGYDYDNFTRKKRRRYLRVFLAILIIILLRGTTIGYPLYELIPMPTYGPDSWQLKVDDVELIENEQITFDDYLYIVSSGDLTIRNSTIIFECTEEYRFGIYLDTGGKLRVENSSIYSNSTKYGFECYIYGRADFIKSNIYNLYGYHGNDYNYGGIYYWDARGEIIDCRISNSKTNGIDCYSSNIKIINTTIRNCNDDGIEIDDSNCKIYNCTIENNLGHGIYIIEASPEIYNCLISNNAGYGIYVDGGTPDLQNNTIENNEKGEISYK